MDPDKVLENLRSFVNRDERYFDYEIAEFLESFQNLDRWISRGGILPKDWETRKDLN